MRATDFFNEDQFGTEPKRPARAGSRPGRGHGAEPRYKSAPVVPGGDNPDAEHKPIKGDEPVQRGDQVLVQDPDNIASVYSGTVKRIGREHVYVTLKNGETIAAAYDEVSKDYDTLSKRAHKILNKKGKHVGNYSVTETPKLSSREKMLRGLKRGGYDVEERSKFWDEKVKEIEAQIAAYDAEKNKEKAVPEGEVVPFRKKEKPKAEKVVHCPKCGDPMQSGKMDGERVKVCVPCLTYVKDHEVDEGWKEKVVAGAAAAALAAAPTQSTAAPSVAGVIASQTAARHAAAAREKPSAPLTAAQSKHLVAPPDWAGIYNKIKDKVTGKDVKEDNSLAEGIMDLFRKDKKKKEKVPNDIADVLAKHSAEHPEEREKRLKKEKPGMSAPLLNIEEECAGVGIVTKQNSTADVGPGTIGKNLKAFKLEGHDDDEYVQQLTSEFIRRAKLGRRYTPAETVLGLLDRFFKKFGISDQYFDDVFHRAVRTTDHEAGILEMETSLEEWKASRKLCRSSTPDSDLGASALSSCKAQGLRARDGNKSHKLGKSPKSRMKMGGHRIKGKKYGGPLPDWS